MHYESLPPAVQTTYLDLLAAVMTAPLPARGVSFVKRPSRSRDYWYLQYVIGESRRSHYLGPDTEELRGLIEKAKTLQAEDAPDMVMRERLVAAGIAGGLQAPSAGEARVYEALAQAGVFEGGGVLVGSHAFANIGNMLGVRWTSGLSRTADIDIARDPHFIVGMPAETRDLEAALRESHRAFFAVPALNPKHPSTRYKIRGQQLSVSVLTPMHGKESAKPVPIPALSTAAEPVRYLEYAMQTSELAAVPARAGILVRVPQPARFALHKLVVSQRRSAREAAKSRKDIAQAGAVIEVLRDLRPGDIRNAIAAATHMGDKFVTQLKEGAGLLDEDIREYLLPLLEKHS